MSGCSRHYSCVIHFTTAIVLAGIIALRIVIPLLCSSSSRIHNQLALPCIFRCITEGGIYAIASMAESI